MAPQYVSYLSFYEINLMKSTQICLSIEIVPKTGSAIFDFDGTGWEVRGNLNAPVSVVHSAVIYCMRAMLDADIPLNAGCLVPLESAPILRGFKNV